MKLVLDTNAYCFCDRNFEPALLALENSTELFLPSIVYGELYYGFKHGQNFKKNLKHLESFIQEFKVEIISVDAQVAEIFGEIFANLRKKGRPIPTNDIWIAACCQFVQGTLLTADQHFKEITEIKIKFLRLS